MTANAVHDDKLGPGSTRELDAHVSDRAASAKDTLALIFGPDWREWEDAADACPGDDRDEPHEFDLGGEGGES